ncbi:MAG TPA: glycoside hydrolase family 65 [Verrucomicrobiae bacterium]|nr:glycoside hydrolase family 65 [Verrucomicrobiae bacterium]
MALTRRAFLGAVPAALAAQGATLDRRAIVSRHNPTLRGFDPRAPLSVGNGEFCFTADCTGLQTFPLLYEKALPLGTMSQWGWETSPGRPPGQLRFTEYDTYGRKVGYPTSSAGQEALFNWLRENPHRLNLGRIGFAIDRPEDVRGIQQTLDLWTGILRSEFEWQGQRIRVETCCHPKLDQVAVRVEGGPVPIVFDFARPVRMTGGMQQFAVAFRDQGLDTAGPEETFSASAQHWARFWSTGAAIDLSPSPELERRVVLSQYLTAIQCAGSLPPQETGLTCNSWFGKFHLEMHFWHAAHFAHWRRGDLLERSLGWYNRILPGAREKARSQGYKGARWPKMTDQSGTDSPSPIGPLLIWQQPHPIVLCELTVGRTARAAQFRDLVFDTAEFMADFAHFDAKTGRYILGPPVIPAQENHPPRETWNPAFELEYWDYALELAQQWRLRAGLAREAKWDDVRSKLSALPVKDGVYLAHENCPQTFTERNRDHPSMLAALGMLPGRKVDRETMRRTLRKVFAEWRWEDAWGWDFPMVAMTAASLAEPGLAIDALMMDTPKNTWLPNGHNWQRANLPCYLPGNGSLLLAIAHMVRTRAFPKDWNVPAEGF